MTSTQPQDNGLHAQWAGPDCILLLCDAARKWFQQQNDQLKTHCGKGMLFPKVGIDNKADVSEIMKLLVFINI